MRKNSLAPCSWEAHLNANNLVDLIYSFELRVQLGGALNADNPVGLTYGFPW